MKTANAPILKLENLVVKFDLGQGQKLHAVSGGELSH